MDPVNTGVTWGHSAVPLSTSEPRSGQQIESSLIIDRFPSKYHEIHSYVDCPCTMIQNVYDTPTSREPPNQRNIPSVNSSLGASVRELLSNTSTHMLFSGMIHLVKSITRIPGGACRRLELSGKRSVSKDPRQHMALSDSEICFPNSEVFFSRK